MAYKPLNPVVAEVSPNLYKAAVTANLPPEQQKIIEQMSFTHKKAKDLLRLSEEQARKQFLELDPIVQSNIRYLFPDKKTFEAEQGLIGKATQAVTSGATRVLKGIASPLLAGFAAADMYGKTINTIPTIYRQLSQDKPFSKQVIKDGYSGKNSFKWDRIAEFEKQYGKGVVSLITSTIDGKTPGEAIDEYGKVDAEILDAIKFYNDEPKKFNKILEEIKLNAQISPGRDVAGRAIQDRVNNKIDTVPEKLLKTLGIDMSTPEGILQAQKVVSGPIDGFYQIGIDPTSWLGVGTALKAATKGIEGVRATPTEALRFIGIKTRGEKLKDKYQFLAERGDVTAGMDFIFRQPDVIKLWDDELGPVVRNFANAQTSQEKADIYRAVKSQYPDWANTEVLFALSKAKTFDSISARKFFIDVDDRNLLLQGNLDGVSFYRNAIPVSKSYRKFTSSVHQTADAIFNPSAANAGIAKSVDNIRLGTAMDILTKVSNERDVLVNPAMAELLKLEKDVNALHKAGRYLQRSPGRILYGEDAIKTVDEVRNLAAQVVRRDLADTIAFEFLNQSEEYQRTIVRNLSYGFMLKQGMIGSPNGKEQMAEILNATFNEKAGMYSTARSEVPQHFVGRVSREAYNLENDVAVQSSKGIVQLSQTAEGTAPLPYEEIAENAAMTKLNEKFRFMTLLGGITRNKFTRSYTNFWSTFTLFPRLGTRTSIDEGFFYFLTAPKEALVKFAFGGRKAVKALSTISGSKSAIGYKRAMYKLFPNMDITQKIPFDKRVELVDELATKLNITKEQVQQEMIRTNLVDRYEDIVETQLPVGAKENMRKLLKNNPSAVDSIANSMGAKTSLSAKVDKEFINAQFTPSNLTKMYEENGLKASKKYRAVDISKLNDLEVAVAHYDNFSIRFSYNGKTVGDGQYVSPVTPFFRHNALKTGGDFELARRDILEQVGVRADLDLNTFDAFNIKKVKDFNKEFSTTVYYRQQGLSDADIARVHIDNMLVDMYNTFHGGPNSYNQKLYDTIVDRHKGLYGYKVNYKSISGGNAGKGTPLGDAKDIAMRAESNAAIVELVDTNIQKNIIEANPKGIGKTSSETSLLRLGPATGDLSGKTIMLARNGKLSGKELRPETIRSIIDANEAGAKFVVGDMPNVDAQFQDLLNKIEANYTVYHTGTQPRTGVVEKPKNLVKAAWAKASASLTEDEFIKLTDGYRPTSGQINTRLVSMGESIDLKNLEDVKGFNAQLDKFQNWAMDIMDAQVNGLYRQPALWIMYSKYMDDLAPYEKKLVTQYQKLIKENNPLLSDNKVTKLAKAQAEKQVVELSWNGAVNELITFADNPNVKSNLAVSVRAVGRFYRATEDFYRRIYRLYTKKPLQTLYRLRLLHTGLQASGDVYEDDKGDLYITFPTDIIVNSAINPVIRVLSGDDDFKVPTFNDFAIKLRLINPSFAPDAGQPAFSGPVAAVGLLTLKSFLRELPLIPGPIKEKIEPTASKAADAVNNIALGNIGKNLDLREAVMPLLGSTIWTTLSPTEADRQKSTAVLQAISYFQAYGYNLPADATVEQTDKYLSDLKIASNSIVAARNMLGQISPAYPALRDTKDLPNYMKDVGITSFKAEFWDIYNSILRNDSENALDAFDLALATFIGKNPGKLAYIVPRNNSTMKVFINKTEEVKNWAVNNSKFIDTYGETAYIFAPRVGEYNPDVYAWMESEGILRFPKGKDEFNRYLKNYLKDVQLSEDRETYFAIESNQKAELAKTADIGERKQIIYQAQQARKSMLNSNPYLKAEIMGNIDNQGELEVKFRELSEIVSTKDSPLDKRSRAAMQLVVSEMSQFLSIAKDKDMSSRSDFSEVKAAKKKSINKIIEEYSKTYPEVREANRLIFRSLLNSYSKDVTTARAQEE